MKPSKQQILPTRFSGAFKRFSKPLTNSTDAIYEAGLDWKVEQRPIFFKASNSSYQPIEGRFNLANVKGGEGGGNRVLGVVGSKYHLIQNRDAFTFFDEMVKSKEISWTGGGEFQGGKKVWLQAKLSENLILFREEEISRSITFITSHDGSTGFMGFFTPERLVCTNQLTRTKKEFSIRHTTGFREKVSEARRVMGLALNFYDEFDRQVETMARKKLDVKSSTQYFETVLKVKNDEDRIRKEETLERVLQLYDSGRGNSNPKVRHTVWTAYNAITEFSDHYSSVRDPDAPASESLRSAWLGSGANLKDRAFSVALEFSSN